MAERDKGQLDGKPEKKTPGNDASRPQAVHGPDEASLAPDGMVPVDEGAAGRKTGRRPGRPAGRSSGGRSASSPRSPGEKGPGRPPLRDDPRAQIVQQAARLFAHKGYEASSLSELAAAMGYSKGAIYNYFSSKQDIYDAIIIFSLTGLYETAAAAVRPEDAPVERLRQYMVAHARFLADNYDCFATMLVGFSGMQSQLKGNALLLRDAHEGLLRQIIADGVEDGSFRAVDKAATGRAVLSLLSWMVRWFRPGGGKSAEDVAAEYHDLLVRGLLP
ncbi:TetR/AcrR family transcriptional regulator [Xanthobacter sp. TB0139]|uniref:TetR/AcrR family transcriptional regulator n=1 Tax=Xanthobacter sp. TB0139 TaxID=3459178 RepID=UPI00403A054C